MEGLEEAALIVCECSIEFEKEASSASVATDSQFVLQEGAGILAGKGKTAARL